MPWTFHLNVTNGTDRDLKVIGSTIPWGYWYRDNVGNRGPMEKIPKGKSVQALGVAAKSGPQGYEFSCTWADDSPADKMSYGTVRVYADVPYWSSNSSECKSSGALFIDGWENLPGSGHNFVRSITITRHPTRMGEVPMLLATAGVGSGKLRAKRKGKGPTLRGTIVEEEEMLYGSQMGKGPLLRAAAEDKNDKLYREYLLAVRENNPDVRDWSSVQSMLTETGGFNPIEQMPKEPRYPPAKMLLARSAPSDVSEDLWSGIGDADYPNEYSKQISVKRYFTAAAYSVNTNPRDVINLARGETRKFSKKVQITSSIRNIQETTWSVKTSLELKSESMLKMKEIAAKMEWQYGVKNVLEQSRTVVTDEVEERTFKAPEDHDVIIIPWVFSTIVLIYRVDFDDKITLIAASDWAQQQICKTYQY